MGHIALATPVSHIWFFKGVPSRMSLVLDISPRDLEEVLYFVSYIVLDKGNTPLMEKQVLSENDYQAYYAKYGNSFRVGMGAEAIKELLKKKVGISLLADIALSDEDYDLVKILLIPKDQIIFTVYYAYLKSTTPSSEVQALFDLIKSYE